MEHLLDLDIRIVADLVIYSAVVLSYCIAFAFLRNVFRITSEVKKTRRITFRTTLFRINNYFKRLVEKGRTTFSNLINLK